MYADGHQLNFAGKTAKDVEDTINEVGKWSQDNDNKHLQGNFSKYQAISFGPKTNSKIWTLQWGILLSNSIPR